MFSRRDTLLMAGLMAGAAGATALLPRLAAAGVITAAQPRTKVNFAVPEGACDCHTHVFGDPKRFPWAAGRTYTPPTAGVEEMRALHKALGTSRVVIVQPSVYGTDNSCTLDGIRQLGAQARGVAVIGDDADKASLDALHKSGIRGVRVNLETAGQTDPAASRAKLAKVVSQIRDHGWHVQVYTRLSVIEALKDDIMAMPIPIVFDHFGGAQASAGLGQPGWATLVEAVKAGKAYVKISGAYRSSTKAPDYADMVPLAQALIGANPDRIVWGSDWPHPDSARTPTMKLDDIAPLYDIDDGALFNQLAVWAPDAAIRRRILVENPARLYDF